MACLILILVKEALHFDAERSWHWLPTGVHGIWLTGLFHRSWLLSFYLDPSKMRHIAYTARELLRLRHKPPQKDISGKLVSKVLEDRDLGKFTLSFYTHSMNFKSNIKQKTSSAPLT